MGSRRSGRGQADQRSSSLHLAYDNVVRRAKERTKKLEAMEVLKRGVFRRLAMSPFHQNLSAERREFIEARLCSLIPQILDRTPNHPPYAEMIQRAIEWLGDEGGASEEAISDYILSTYKHLPWAHLHLLPHHLRRLTEAGEIKATPNSRYSLSLSNPEQHQQPDDDDDAAVLEETVRNRSCGKRRKEPSQRSQSQKRGRGNQNKKCRSEKEETLRQLQVEIERKHPSSPPLSQPQRGGFSRKRGCERQIHPGQASRTEHFDGEGLIIHPKEPPDVMAGEEMMQKSLIVKFKATPHRKHEQRSRRGQKQPDEHVDCDSLMQMTVARNIDNNGSTSTVPCSDETRALVGETGASKPNGEEHLQIVLSSTQQLKEAEARTASSDANESFTGLSSGKFIASMEGKGAPVSEDEKPFQTQEQQLLSPHRGEELNHPELESFATNVGNHGPMDAALEKGAFVTECNQLLQWQQHPSTPVVEQQKHPEVGSPASLANNDALMVLPAGPPMVVEDVVRENEKSKEQLPQEQQLSLQCAGDDDDDAIVVFCWRSKSIKKEKEGSPSKKSESTVRRSTRLANLFQQGEQVQTKPLTGVLLSLPAVKREEEVVFAIEPGKNVKEKQSSEQQQKPNRKANQLKKQNKGLRIKTELLLKKQKPKHHREEQKESGSEMEPSQNMQNLQPKSNRKEQNESGTKLKPSKKKQEQQRKHHSEEQKESVTEIDPSQKKKQEQQCKRHSEEQQKESVIEIGPLQKKKQEQQRKRHSEEQREAGTEMEPSQKKHKQQAKHHSEEQKESGSEMKPLNVWKQQPGCHVEEQIESAKKIESSQKKQEQQRKPHGEEQKESVTEIEPSQKKQKQQPKHHRKEQKKSGSKMEPLQKKQPRRYCKEQAESGTEMKPSQRKINQQSECHSEEQDESVTEMEPLQKKQDGYLEEEPKEVETKMEVSQKQRMELGMSRKEPQIRQNQEEPKGQMRRGGHPKGSGLQKKVPGKRGRPPKGTGLLEKQQGPKEQDENVEQDKASPLDVGVASAVGDVQLGKSQMTVKYQEPSESQKKARNQGKLTEKEVPLQARGRGRPPKKKEVPVERTFQVQGWGDKDLPAGQGEPPKEGHVKTRARGRPPKELPMETTGEVQNCGDKEVNVEKRGRGRPRKKKEVPAETTVEIQAFGDKEATMGQGKPPNEEVAVEPMGRRRPLKEVAVKTRGQGSAPKKEVSMGQRKPLKKEEVLWKTRGSKQVTQEGGSCGDNCSGSGSRLRKAS